MNWLSIVGMGRKALAMGKAAVALAADIDLDVVGKVLIKIVELEIDPQYAGRGQGPRKVSALLTWFETEFPRYAYTTARVRMFATAVVGLMNVVRVFRA